MLNLGHEVLLRELWYFRSRSNVLPHFSTGWTRLVSFFVSVFELGRWSFQPAKEAKELFGESFDGLVGSGIRRVLWLLYNQPPRIIVKGLLEDFQGCCRSAGSMYVSAIPL